MKKVILFALIVVVVFGCKSSKKDKFCTQQIAVFNKKMSYIVPGSKWTLDHVSNDSFYFNYTH